MENEKDSSVDRLLNGAHHATTIDKSPELGDTASLNQPILEPSDEEEHQPDVADLEHPDREVDY